MPKNIAITIKERRFLEAYHWLKKTRGKKPSVSELARSLGYASNNSIYQFLSSLHRKGINPDRYRLEKPVVDMPKATYKVPVIGSAPCGAPFLAQENWEGEIPVDVSLLRGNLKEYFFLRAKGNSMNRAEIKIEDGDYVLFHSQPTANPGEIVVALLGDEATIKIFRPGDGYVVLAPKSSDPRHKPIIVTENLLIQGVVKKVIKKELIEGGEQK